MEHYTDRQRERQIELLKYKKARRKKKAKAVFTIFVSLLLSVGIVVTLFFAPVFNVVEIYAVGNDRIAEDYIIAAANVRLGDNVFATSVQRIISNVSAIPYVREANARRIFPNRIRVWVSEAEPQANIAVDEFFAAIDERGMVLEILQHPYDVPIIRGLNVDRLVPGERPVAYNSANFMVGLSLLSEIIANDLINNIVSIDVANLTQISMNFENRINVIIGDANNLDYRIMFFAHIMSTILPHEQGIIDMSLENPYFRRTN